MIEHRFIDTLELRTTNPKSTAIRTTTRADGDIVIAGYAAVFYREGDPGSEFELWDDTVERIMPGAFDRALREKDDVRGLFNHNPDKVLGRTTVGSLRLWTDKKGLAYRIDAGNTSISKDIYELVQRGEVSGASISFIVDDVRWWNDGEKDIREILSIGKLFDVGPVSYPAFESTTAGVQKPSRKARSRFELPVDATGLAQPDSVRAESNRILATLSRRRREIDLLLLQ